jgi:tetratricopeptide (TPR) repeat protein
MKSNIKKIIFLFCVITLTSLNYCENPNKKEGKIDSNENTFLPVSSTNKEAVEFYRNAMDNLFKKEYSEARTNFISALKLDPNFILANLFINESNQELKEKYKKRAFQNISKANPYEVFELKSDSLINTKGWGQSYDERKELINDLEKIYSNIPEFNNRKASVIGNKYFAPNASKSIEFFKKAIKINPSYYVPYNNLMEFKYIRQNEILKLKTDENFYSNFDKELNLIVKKFPNNTEILSTAAKLYSNSYNSKDIKRLEKAVELIEKAIEVSKKDTRSNLNIHYRTLSGIYSNGGKIKESTEVIKFALDSAQDDQQLIDTYFDLFSINIYNGNLLDAVKSIDEFESVIGGFGFSKEKILKCKVGLNFYKSVIYAHANQSMRTKESINNYLAASSDLMAFFKLDENDPDLNRKINSLPGNGEWKGNMWKTMRPGWSEDNVIWLNTIIGDHSYAAKIHAKKEERTGNRALWIDGISEVLKGNVQKGYDIFKENTFLAYHQYFMAQAALNLGKKDEAKLILQKIMVMPPLENFYNDYVIVRSRKLLETL